MSLIWGSMDSIKQGGLGFITRQTWDPVNHQFGALPFIIGTLLTSGFALILTIPFSLAISLFLGEYFTEGFLQNIIKSMVELLAGIPSIVYGFWGLLILVPVIQKFQMKTGMMPYGVGILAASIILAIMILPYSASIGREVIQMVPSELKEAAFSLGATRFEVIKSVTVPYAKSGIFAGIFLALGRALGETMAVTMVIGNSNMIPKNIFGPGNTMASLIANEFTEATGDLYLSALIEIGLLLFIITGIINLISKRIIKRFDIKQKNESIKNKT